MDLDPARIHGHGPRCPCDHCAWQMRHATAAYRLARGLRGLRALAWIEPIRTERRN